MKQVWIIQDEDGAFGVFETAADAKKAYGDECKTFGDEPPKWEKPKGTKNLWRAKGTSLGGWESNLHLMKYPIGELCG
jgi:hypothetical protein